MWERRWTRVVAYVAAVVLLVATFAAIATDSWWSAALACLAVATIFFSAKPSKKKH